MKVFITGGCGYIGYSLVNKLLTKSNIESITIFDNLINSNINFFFGVKDENYTKLNFIKGNVLDNYNLAKSLPGHDIVIHLAAKVSTPFSQSSLHEFDQVNNWGTANLVSEVERTTEISRFVHMSSISVYGDSNGLEVSEISTTSPKTAYGTSKLRAEKHVKRLSETRQFFIIRAANVFGYNPCIRFDSVVNKLMFDSHFNKKVEIFGSGLQKRAFIEIDDLTNLVARYCNENIDYPEVINAVTLNHSINEIVDTIQEIQPNVDRVYLDQHLQMRSIAATTNFSRYNISDTSNLKDHLFKFKKLFRL